MKKKTQTKIKVISTLLGAAWGIGSIVIGFALMEEELSQIWYFIFFPLSISVVLITRFYGQLFKALSLGPSVTTTYAVLVSLLATPFIGAAIGWLIGKVIIWILTIRGKRNT